MRKLLRLLLLVGVVTSVTSPVSAQVTGPIGLTATSSDCSTAGSCAAFTAIPHATYSMAVTVSGTYVGTLTFEGTANGSVWSSVLAFPSSTGTGATTTTGTGIFVIYNGGYVALRVRCSAYTSGLALVSATPGKQLTATGGVISAPILVPDGSASAPSYSFINDPTSGWYRNNTNDFHFAVGGNDVLRQTGTQTTLTAGNSLGWGATGTFNADLFLVRDLAGTLAERNGANAMAFRVYNTFTDGSNYERADISWITNTFVIGPAASGTGSIRNLQLGQSGTNNITFRFNGGGGVLFNADNTNDIGAVGTNRPKNVYVGGFVETGVTTVASLPTCNANLQGARSFVTDATATTFLSAVAGSGANPVPVVCDGTSWKIG